MKYNCGVVPANLKSKLFNFAKIFPFKPFSQHTGSTGMTSSIVTEDIIHPGRNQ